MSVTSADSFARDYNSEAIVPGKPFNDAEITRLKQHFLTEGWLYVPRVLSASDVSALRTASERKFADPMVRGDLDNDQIRGVGLMRMFEYSLAFRQLIAREPLIDLVEAILGPDCHLISQNALRTPAMNGIVDWHIDGELLFPFLVDLKEQSVAAQLPCFGLSVMIPLTEVEHIEFGPTQVVPRSHTFGYVPNNTTRIETFGPVTINARAGDAYLLNHQLWHRGAQNMSDRIRHMAVTAYGRRFMQQRFYPFLNYLMPAHVLNGADGRLLRLLGRHDKGPFG